MLKSVGTLFGQVKEGKGTFGGRRQVRLSGVRFIQRIFFSSRFDHTHCLAIFRSIKFQESSWYFSSNLVLILLHPGN